MNPLIRKDMRIIFALIAVGIVGVAMFIYGASRTTYETLDELGMRLIGIQNQGATFTFPDQAPVFAGETLEISSCEPGYEDKQVYVTYDLSTEAYVVNVYYNAVDEIPQKEYTAVRCFQATDASVDQVKTMASWFTWFTRSQNPDFQATVLIK